MSRAIVHLDADAFFASVEQAADTRLRGRPVAVGGDRRGIIASASYEARKFGIYTPMPTSRARKLCPRLIVLPGNYERYEQYSRWMFSYAQDFTPDVEIASIDEGYFDLTAVPKSPVAVADTIRTAISQSLKISVSEGIACNKLVSQIASKMNKPGAFRAVPEGGEIPFLHPLPNKWLPGVGPKTAERLNAAGLAQIRHVAATPLDLLGLLLGSAAPVIHEYANGIDTRLVVPTREPARSFSEQETFAQDLTDEEYLEAVLRRMADNLFAKVREERKSIRTLTVKVRYNDMAEDQCGESLWEPTDLETDVYGKLHTLFRQAWKRRVSLRMVSLRLSNVYDGLARSELVLDEKSRKREARERLSRVVDELRKSRGAGVVMRGHDFRLRDAPQDAIRNAELHSAVSQSCNLPAAGTGQGAGISPSAGNVSSPSPLARVAECNSAVQQSSTLRYGKLRATTVPLNVRSYYSFLNSTLSPQAIVDLAVRHQLPAVALTDVGNLHGAVEFSLAARKAGIKPIIGAEIRVGKSPVLLLVGTAAGYGNLCRLLSREISVSDENGRRGSTALPEDDSGDSVAAQELRPFRREALAGRTDGLIAVAADPGLAELFPDRFYQAVISPKAGEPVMHPGVACPRVHYATPEDRLKFDIVQSIRTRTLLRQEHPLKRLDGEFHFRPPRELEALFRQQPRSLERTLEIAARCEFELKTGAPQFPAFATPDGSGAHEHLRRLVMSGLRRRYGGRAGQFESQIREELDIIAGVGYEEYFLVVLDILEECRRRGIEWITRGSAADSLVCYCLGISSVCPIRFDLYFRRFLNRERMKLNKLPDIDVDFPHDRKDDVVDLIFEKYGTAHAAVVGGFSTFQARSAVADVAKVLGVSEFQIRRFTEHFPWAGAGEIEEAVQQKQECRDLPANEEPFRTALQMAAFLDGFPRHPKMHPCGVVLSRQPMQDLTPLFTAAKGWATTHYDMDSVEAIGLVKIDILAQGGLSVMRDTLSAVRSAELHSAVPQICNLPVVGTGQGVGISPGTGSVSCPSPLPRVAECNSAVQQIENLRYNGNGAAAELEKLEPWTDPEIWQMLANGGGRAVHHIESPAMIGLCQRSRVRDIDGLVAIVSVIRPGAANERKKLHFVLRYQGLEPVSYPHPSLEACLKGSFGLVIYEEHVLQICEAFAGLPPGRADVLRRALAKHKRAVIGEIRGEFFTSARDRGHPEEEIRKVWELLEGFAGYAFCKAHSTAYAVEAWQSAWLKLHHPVEFMAAVLSNGKGFYQPLVYILECHRLGIPILPPSARHPGPMFTVENGAIRVPLSRVKGLSETTCERMIREGAREPFTSLPDFYHRVLPGAEELESMIRVGGFDCYGKTRTAQFWEAQQLRHAWAQSVEPGQGWLLPPPDTGHLPSADLVEPTRRQRLEWETELLGFTASGHPLELFDHIVWETYCPVNRLGEHRGERVVSCGLVIEQRIHHTVTGEPMKFMTLADRTGIVETELFAPTYRNYGLATVRYPVLEVEATVEPHESGSGFSLRIHRVGKPREKGAVAA
jgi:DNA-directed DNA polymerase III PolC